MTEQKNQAKKISIVLILAIAIFFGFIAGIAGEYIEKYYLSQFGFFRDLYFTEQGNTGNRDIVIKEANKVVVEQDTRINQVINDAHVSVVPVYENKTQVPGKILENIILPEDFLGQAVILTSDGWLISTGQVIKASDDLVISYNKKNYNVEKIIKDDLTNVVFLKVDIQNLPVIKIANAEKITNGQQVISYDSYNDQIRLLNILDKRYKTIKTKNDYLNSSQKLNKMILLNEQLSSNFNGAPILNFQGEVVGLVLDNQTAVPIHYINLIIEQVLKEEDIKRPYLGLNYINIDEVIGLSDIVRQNQKKGALITADSNGIAVEPESPFKDILNQGDIIISMEGNLIEKDFNLADLLLEYKTGQEINIKYFHDNEEKETNVIIK